MNLPVIDTRKTGRNIAALRAQRNISVKELQFALGFAASQAIYKWRHGDSLPTLDNLLALSAIFGVPVEAILVTKASAWPGNETRRCVDSSNSGYLVLEDAYEPME